MGGGGGEVEEEDEGEEGGPDLMEALDEGPLGGGGAPAKPLLDRELAPALAGGGFDLDEDYMRPTAA